MEYNDNRLSVFMGERPNSRAASRSSSSSLTRSVHPVSSALGALYSSSPTLPSPSSSTSTLSTTNTSSPNKLALKKPKSFKNLKKTLGASFTNNSNNNNTKTRKPPRSPSYYIPSPAFNVDGPLPPLPEPVSPLQRHSASMQPWNYTPPTPPPDLPVHSRFSSIILPTQMGHGDADDIYSKPPGLANIPVLPYYPSRSKNHELTTHSLRDDSPSSSSSSPSTTTHKRDRSSTVATPRKGLTRRASILSFTLPSQLNLGRKRSDISISRKISDLSLSDHRLLQKGCHSVPASTTTTAPPTPYKPSFSSTPVSAVVRKPSLFDDDDGSLDNSFPYVTAYFDSEDVEPFVFQLSNSGATTTTSSTTKKTMNPPGSRAVVDVGMVKQKPYHAPTPTTNAELAFQHTEPLVRQRQHQQHAKKNSWVGEWNRNDMSEVIHALRELK